MKRTSFLTGLIFPALLAVVPACSDDAKCIDLQLECRGVCVDTTTSPIDCGTCGHACATNEACVASTCEAVCAPSEQMCGGVCTDTTTVTDCGGCGVACAVHGECVAGDCQNPLALLQTSFMDGTEARDLYLLEDGSLDLSQINATGTVADHVILPDGDVVIVADLDTAGVNELYRVSPRGGTPTKLNPPLIAGGTVEPGVVVSADGTKLLYRADADVTDAIDLYALALAQPGVAVRVDAPQQEFANVSRVIAISANGRRAAYIADQDTDGLNEAYTVDLSAATPGASVKISQSFGDSIWDLQMSSDGSRVVYRGGFGPQLYAVDTATPGTSDVIQNSDGGEGYVENYQLAADGSAVIYTSARFFLQASLWVAPLGTAPLDSTLLVDGTVDGEVRADFVPTADRTRVFFRKLDSTTGVKRLYRVDVATPGELTLLSSDVADATAHVTDFALSRDGRSLVFRGGADGAEGGSPQHGTDPPSSFEQYAPAIYHVDLSTVPAGAPVLLSPAVVPAGDGIGAGFQVTDDRRVLFRADFDQATFSDVYLAAVATAGTIRKVSPPLDTTTDATDVSLISLFR